MINITNNFLYLEVFVHNNPGAEAQRSYADALSLSCNSTLPVHNPFECLPQGYCGGTTPKS